ncbi:MAG: BON domain-containing protein [Holosporales bacterium]|jgi:osmotically-inducible protein OsmY|nr:BON domain-containing protein [Holosporales bacterium]
MLWRFFHISCLCLLAWGLTRCAPVAIIGSGAVVGVSALREKSAIETVSDTVLSAKVSQAIYKISPDVHATVGVNVQEGEVLLTGVTPTDDLKIRVEQAVWRVRGVKQVYNDVAISDSPPIKNYPKDAWITSQIKTKLLANSKIRSLNYSIKTVNNVVYIFGIARSSEELDTACNIARKVKGVERVMSYVRLKDGITAG